MVAGMLTMGLYSALPAMPLPCTTKAVFSWMPTCATHCAGQRNILPKHPHTCGGSARATCSPLKEWVKFTQCLELQCLCAAMSCCQQGSHAGPCAPAITERMIGRFMLEHH